MAGARRGGSAGGEGDDVAADAGSSVSAGVSQASSLPRVHDRQPVAVLGFVHEVGGQRGSVTPLAVRALICAEVTPQVDAGAGVEAGAGLVQQQHARAVEQPLGDLRPGGACPPLNVPTRSRGAIGRGSTAPAQLVDAPLQVRAAQAVEVALVGQVFLGGELLVEAGGLEDDADVPADRSSRSVASSCPRIADVPAASGSASRGCGTAWSCRCRWGRGSRRSRPARRRRGSSRPARGGRAVPVWREVGDLDYGCIGSSRRSSNAGSRDMRTTSVCLAPLTPRRRPRSFCIPLDPRCRLAAVSAGCRNAVTHVGDQGRSSCMTHNASGTISDQVDQLPLELQVHECMWATVAPAL